MRQPNGLRGSGPKTWSWTHGMTRRRGDERFPQTALLWLQTPAPARRNRSPSPVIARGPTRLSAALAMSTYGRIRPYCRLCPTKRHTPLPRSRSVVIEVTKIVDIDQPQAVIVNHIELVVPVLRERSTQAAATAPVPSRARLHPRRDTRSKVRQRTTTDTGEESLVAVDHHLR